MEMLLMGACLALFGTAVACLAFGAATNPEQRSPAVQPELEPVVAPEATRFFAEEIVLPIAARAAQPAPARPSEAAIALLLAQIENHIRLEQAAAESFVEMPTPMMLHSKTTSAFIN